MTSSFTSALLATLFVRYAPATGTFEARELRDGVLVDSPAAVETTAPLGSIWKLFVFLYYADHPTLPAPAYECTGNDPDEVFCCERRGERVALDVALYRSCTPAFTNAFRSVTAAAWKTWWTDATHDELPELAAKERVAPATTLRVPSLLRTLTRFREKRVALATTQSALAKVSLAGTVRGAVAVLGSNLRVKTYTWDKTGGFAGWLADGSSVWLGGPGTSVNVVKLVSEPLALQLARIEPAVASETRTERVCVNFFARYPVAAVVDVASGKVLMSGALHGDVDVRFTSGTHLGFRAEGTIQLHGGRLTGCFPLAEYVARVLEREVRAEPAEAAKAFAVLARTYVLRNARSTDGRTLEIDDSTRFQRVSIQAPSRAARLAASWTDMLILAGEAPVSYRSDRSAGGALGWLDALDLAARGSRFDQILRIGFPKHRLDVMPALRPVDCTPFPEARAWLEMAAAGWHARLRMVAGYERPAHVEVCRLDRGAPYAEPEKHRIHVRALGGTEDELTLAHEYLHVALQNHPRSRDERFVEAKARELVAGAGARPMEGEEHEML